MSCEHSFMLIVNQADKGLCKRWNKYTVGFLHMETPLLHKFLLSIDESGRDESVSENSPISNPVGSITQDKLLNVLCKNKT